MRLRDTVAIVMGTGTGLGRVIALMFGSVNVTSALLCSRQALPELIRTEN